MPSATDLPVPPKSPKIDAVEFAEGYLGDIGPEEFLEGLEFSGLDLAEVDATGATFLDSALRRISFADGGQSAGLTGVRISGSRIQDCRADTLTMPRANLLHTEIVGSRIGAGVAYDSVWERVRVENCRISYLNLRSASLKDVEFRDCVIDEIDLDRTTLTRVSFPGSAVGVLQVEGARLRSVDLRGLSPRRISGIQSLRGATIDGQQLMMLAELFAAELGIAVASV